MSFNFVIPEFNIGGAGTPTFTFYRRGFNIGGTAQPSWRDVILSGIGSLTLTNAKANGLNYLKLFGKCEQDGTPTPTTPVDIVCNNGAIKFSPNEFNPNAVELGYYRNATTGEITPSPYNFLTDFMPVKPNTSYVLYGRKKSNNSLSAYNRIYWFNENQEFISVCSYTINTVTIATSPANAYYAQVGINESGGTSIPTTKEIVDSYNWVFQKGTSEVPYIPYVEGGLYINGTTETVAVSTFSQDDYLDAFCSISGRITSHTTSRSFIIPCKPNTEYRFILDNTGLTSPRCVVTGFTNKPEIGMSVVQGIYTASNSYSGLNDTTFTTESNINYLLFWVMYQKNDTETKAAVDKAILYETSLGATAEPLLSVGNYKDEQNVTNGQITRNVGVLVLTGTESWNLSGSGNALRVDIRTDIGLPPTQDLTSPMMCTHYPFDAYFSTGGSTQPGTFNAWSGAEGYFLRFSIVGMNITTVAQWKDWLVEQYAAGTPVIVVYPLATATTESVTAQPLTIQAGTNIVEITQASIDNLELEVSYKAGVEVTVEEIEAVNNDESVEVTING